MSVSRMDLDDSNMEYSAAEIEAAQALIRLSQQPVIFSQPAPPTEEKDPYETETDEDIFAPGAPGYKLRKPKTASDDDDTAPTIMSRFDTVMLVHMATIALTDPSKPWFHELLKRKPLQDFVRFGLRAAKLDAKAEARISAVMDALTVWDRNCVQEVCWYLEACSWNVNEAITLYHVDEKVRFRRKKYLHASANTLANQVTRFTYTPSDLQFQIPDLSNPNQSGEGFVATFATPETFNQYHVDHIKALNQWRNDLTRMFHGPPSTDDFPPTSTKYSEFEDRFLRNRFGSRIQEILRFGKAFVVEKITEEFNTIFAGRCLPRTYSPCSSRNVTSVGAHVDALLGCKGNGNEDVSYVHVMMQIQNTRSKEQADFERLMAARPAGDQVMTDAF